MTFGQAPDKSTIMAWAGESFEAAAVKTYEKRCSDCGDEFQIFQK
jgi:hypothetical protein